MTVSLIFQINGFAWAILILHSLIRIFFKSYSHDLTSTCYLQHELDHYDNLEFWTYATHENITVISWASWHLKSPAKRQFVSQFVQPNNKSDVKVLHYWIGSLSEEFNWHYSGVIMSVMVSQIMGITIVYSIVCSGTDQRKHQNSVSLAFERGIHQWIPHTKVQ